MYFTRYCRSVLFTPALFGERFARGQHMGADISLVDLEDSISPRLKEEARRSATGFFALREESGARLAIRINNLCQANGLADLLAIKAWSHKPDIVMLPKVESARDIEIAGGVLNGDCAHIDFMAIVETARGLQNVSAIAAASPRLKALVFGSADFSCSINSTMSWEALAHARAQLVTAARAAGLHVVDTATFDIRDTNRLVDEATRARDMGFSGKAAVHPRQVAVINQVFSPEPAALEAARRIVAQWEATEGNICVVDGQMVGAPIVEAARRTLGEFGEALPAAPCSEEKP